MASAKLRKLAPIVSAASPAVIETAASRLGAALPSSSWLPSTNPYVPRAPQEIEREFPGKKGSKQLGKNSTAASNLAEYVAASVVLHCADGWAYLGRAVAAQLRGDIGAARHLGYYAELRAAMSLLASQGIGVFAWKHVLVKASGDVEIFVHAGTHGFAWMALEAWSKTARSAGVVTGVIQPADAPFGDWVDAFTLGSTSGALGTTYLLDWGLDVKRFGSDRTARNESSYQPRTVTGVNVPPTARAVAFTSDLWEVFEPTGEDSFGKLDLYLLRRTLERYFSQRTGKTVTQRPGEFRAHVRQALNQVAATMPKDRLEAFLMREDDGGDPTLLDDAQSTGGLSDPEDHLHVMARAALLLRVSSGCARSLLQKAQLAYSDFEWWSEQLGVGRALIGANAGLASPVDLWDDVSDALTELDSGLARGASADYSRLHVECARELSVLGGCERIALWGLAA